MQKISYIVAAGIEWIDGKPVPPNRRVSLTEDEARFDLAHGRLTLPPPRKSVAKAAT